MRESHRRELVAHELQQLKPLADRISPYGYLEDRYLFFALTTRRGLSYFFRLDLADYDVEPPHLDRIDETLQVAHDRSSWPPGKFVERFDHPDTGHPWVCMHGLRLFYEHPLHAHQRWDSDRQRIRLPVLLGQIVRLFDENTGGL